MPEKEIDLAALLFRGLKLAMLGMGVAMAALGVWALGLQYGLIEGMNGNVWICAFAGILAGAAAGVSAGKEKDENCLVVTIIGSGLFYIITLLLAAAGEGEHIRFGAAAIPSCGMVLGWLCANVTKDNKQRNRRRKKRHNKIVGNHKIKR